MRRISPILSILTAALIILTVNLASPAHGDDAAKAPASQPTTATTAPVVVKWEDAAKHVGETVTVTGPVKGTHVTTGGKSLVLNIGKDFPDATRMSIMITTDADHPAKAEDYKDKSVTVTGKVELYRKVAEIKIAKAADVTIEK